MLLNKTPFLYYYLTTASASDAEIIVYSINHRMEKNIILVTGGAGFIGSHLCRRLLELDNHVICMDNLFTGRLENIEDLRVNPGFEFIEHDVTKEFDIQCDMIFDLACPASPVHYQYDPVKTIKTSFIGALNALENAKKYDARVLLASTSEVYGDPEVHPQPESYWGHVNPIGIRSCYDEGKRVAETLFFDYNRKYGTEIKVVRIFNTYGPNMREDDGRVVSNFIIQALSNDDITVYGDGSQTRSFCYVSDLVEGLVRMMDSGDGFKGPVNLGNPTELTMLEIAQKIIDFTGSKSRIVYLPLPQDDPVRRKPVIDLAWEELRWKPSVSVDDGLRATISYFAERMNRE